MGTSRSGPGVRPRADDGFTIVEGLVAVTILAIAIVVSIQPVVTALRGVSDARVISVGENLAQAEIETLRALKYEDLGLPGRTPSGTLTASREIVVEGRRYVLDLDIQYAGSVTGLDVIPQGGDGVEGTWDPGVDYKVATVTVVADGRESDPIVMQTIIAPTRVGQHEGIANARVLLDAHEPFAPSNLDLPLLTVQDLPSAPIVSAYAASEQVWPAIPPGAYTVLVENSNGWIIHPDDVVSGLDQLTVVAGSTAETTLRVFRPATFEIQVLDAETEAAVTDARLTLTNNDTGQATAYTPGEYLIENLMPNAYKVSITAPDYETWELESLNIPAAYPDPYHLLTVYLQPLTPPSSTTTTEGGSSTTSTTTTIPGGDRVPIEFTVVDNSDMVIAGASVVVTHPSDGPFSGVTDAYGRITFNLLDDDDDYTAVGSTDWGHGPDSDPVNTGGWIDDLELSRPSGKGKMTLTGGDDAEFLYRSSSNQPWTVMPANYQEKASFVADQGWYEVAKRCLVDGEVKGIKDVYVKANRNRNTSISGWCPSS